MTARYTRVAVALHWLIAAVVAAQVGWGWLMQQIPKSPPGLRADAFNVHKSIGLCILALMLVRLGWRLAHAPPALPPMPRWRARAAKLTHVALYAALIVMPLAGYLGSAFSGYPVKWFGLTLPAWAPASPALKTLMSNVHLVTSIVLVSLIALHVAAAIEHALRGDGVLARMSFGARASARPARPIGIAAGG
jgi:cytochrome b561